MRPHHNSHLPLLVLKQLTELKIVAVNGELRTLSNGDYTLMHDRRSEHGSRSKTATLDLFLHMTNLDGRAGGQIVYAVSSL